MNLADEKAILTKKKAQNSLMNAASRMFVTIEIIEKDSIVKKL
jgi:hypothetical protein